MAFTVRPRLRYFYRREHHAWDEFKKEMKHRDKLQQGRDTSKKVKTYLESVFAWLKHKEYANEVLEDGLFFFHEDSVTGLDWTDLNQGWQKEIGNE